jgi:aminoglycoside phosphotransferase
MPNIITTPTGKRYFALGRVQNSHNVWLIRHALTQQLYLLQRMTQSPSTLTPLLCLGGAQMPRILESWTDQGALYIVLERVNGVGLDNLSRQVIDSRTQGQMNRLLAILSKLGVKQCPQSALYLNPDAGVSLRWFPPLGGWSDSPPAARKTSWFGHLRSLLFSSKAS